MTVDNSVTMRGTYERINAGDLDGFGELVADDYVEQQGGLGFPPTKEGMLEFLRSLLTAFPDFRMDVEDLIASGDKTVARVRCHGDASR
jgi:ketosteroid isomerase-like protein